MCKGKNFIDSRIGNIYKTIRTTAGFHKNTYVFLRKPADCFHPELFPFFELFTIILLYSYLFFILNLNMMNIISG
ncbi:hypothetical protein DWW90_17655 [Parabacteroides sp. AF17-28]|nr:hypothetical protein DWW90_17655 [Parabacteroides sp. AF17-28]